MPQINDKLNKLKEVIHKAVPEILELKFGCEVEVKNREIPYGTWDAIITWVSDKGLIKVRSFDVEVTEKIENLIILGRPIRLADVLLVIHEVEDRPMYFNIGCDGGFYEVNYTYPDNNHCVIEHNGIGGIGCGWDFAHDSLDSQSEETINFLFELLCK